MMKTHSEELKKQKLSELIPTSSIKQNEYFLESINTDGSTAEFLKSYEPGFESKNIIDGWKYIPKKYWYHPLHQLSAYLGRFPPAIARYFISKFSRKDEVIYDPFCGSGTVPLEACLLKRGAIGNDTFIYGYVLSHAKACPLSREQYDKFITFLKPEVDKRLKRDQIDTEDPLLSDIQVYYHPQTLQQILAIRSVLSKVGDDENYQNATLYLKAMMCGILHGETKMFLSVQTKDTWSASVEYVRKYLKDHDLKPEPRDVFECLDRKANRIYSEPLPSIKGFIDNCNIIVNKPSLDDESVDLIVTSPPYLNVRNYALDNWIRVWFLGSNQKTENEKMLKTQVVINYESSMNQALQQMYRVLKPNRACVIIVADVQLRTKGKPIYRTTYKLAEMASEIGFNIITIFNDTIKLNRRTSQLFNAKRYGEEMVDSVPHDSVLILSKGNCPIYDNTSVNYSVQMTEV